MEAITIIEKELIETTHFPSKEVLKTPEQIGQRLTQAKKASTLGNSVKHKVKIVFEDSEGKKMVETTIWGVTEKYLLLKKGMSVPLCRVHEIIIN
ncbi:MAG: hypothetical protein HKL88_05125 [Bacteroidia bacterium]|jgi:hypothetical protein|nr:hypothetical protein [Bacteroidia bacterium]